MMTTTEILINSRRAINDIETLTHLYPKLRILNFTFDDHDGMSVLVAQDTFDDFRKYLSNCYYEQVEGYNNSTKYRSTGRYGHCEIVGFSTYKPVTYHEKKTEEVAEIV